MFLIKNKVNSILAEGTNLGCLPINNWLVPNPAKLCKCRLGHLRFDLSGLTFRTHFRKFSQLSGDEVMTRSKNTQLISALLLALSSGYAAAGGFQLLEENVSGLGNTYAGSVAVAENATTIFF
jgi:hypothetical protein